MLHTCERLHLLVNVFYSVPGTHLPVHKLLHLRRPRPSDQPSTTEGVPKSLFHSVKSECHPVHPVKTSRVFTVALSPSHVPSR
ncbi:hypothetical protein CGRA01v4_02525 [Colletotrichum graminicola]|nr:hypothetical protein CGRA01v4_02525 [Colletotrichum graminicola]